MRIDRRVVATLCVAVGLVPGMVSQASAEAPSRVAADQVLTWTTDDQITRYTSAPTEAVAGVTTIVFENSEATGNATGMPHTLTFDTSTEGYNHDVTLNILANPFDPNNGRHEATVTLTPGRYRYFCSIPGHSQMVGEFVVTGGGGGDTTPPTVSAQVSGERDAGGNYVGSATVTVTATDAESGVATVETQTDGGAWAPYTAPVVVNQPRSHMVHYRATDVAGNTSPEGMAMFTVVEPPAEDTTPPSVSAQVSGDRDQSGNYIGDATVTVTATDTESGVSTVEYGVDGGPWIAYTAPVVVTVVGGHTVRYRATDNAGNVSEVKTVTFTVVVPGGDACPNSDDRPTVVIGGRNSGVANVDTGNGCTINDLIAENAEYPDHATFVRHVDAVTAPLVTNGVLTRRDQGAIMRAAAQSDIGTRTVPRGACHEPCAV